MKVLKRDGRLEEFNSNNIRKQTSLACEGLKGTDPGELELSAGILFKDKMPSTEIQNGLINAARLKVSIDRPNWTYVAARLALYDLYHNIERYYGVEGSGDVYQKVSLWTYIDKNRDILGDFFNKYTKEEIDELNTYIDPKRDLLYDYAGMSTMLLRYLTKRANVPLSIREYSTNNVSIDEIVKQSEKVLEKVTYDSDGKPVYENVIIELPQFLHMGVAMFAAAVEKTDELKMKWAKRYYEILSKLEFIAATPINSNSRKRNGSTASCFVGTPADNLSSIADVYKEIMLGSSAGKFQTLPA